MSEGLAERKLLEADTRALSADLCFKQLHSHLKTLKTTFHDNNSNILRIWPVPTLMKAPPSLLYKYNMLIIV